MQMILFLPHHYQLTFGIKKVAIAKQVENSFDVVAKEISKLINLLLKGDSFYVKVEGNKGILT